MRKITLILLVTVLAATSSFENSHHVTGSGQVLYFNDFNGVPGSDFPGWSSPGYSCVVDGVTQRGEQKVTNVLSANGIQTFLGEFGGPRVVPPGSKPVIKVDEQVRLSLQQLVRHKTVVVEFDLYVLKSWDGNSPQYGEDIFRLSVDGGPTLINTTFSNNLKVAKEGSFQNYPSPGSNPQLGAVAVATLGYTFFKDATYHLKFAFEHTAESLTLVFFSSLFEGKGTDDESWGLDNVRIAVTD